MRRRSFIATSAATLAAPRIGNAQAAKPLRFVPDADLAIVDPVVTTSYQTRDHGFMVWDTLYGQDNAYRVRPQMVEGHVVENDGKTWKLTLRDGLMFHDGERVLARDAVASISRWGKRDSFGGSLMAAVEEISAPDDRTILFRLKTPFPLLPDALGHYSPNMCAIMPARIAAAEATKPRNEPAERTAGGKVVHIERVEWLIMPDTSTVASALTAGSFNCRRSRTCRIFRSARCAGRRRIGRS